MKRLSRLEKIAHRLVVNRDAIPERNLESSVGMLAIDALNVWDDFSKWYLISCLLGTRTPDGRILTGHTGASDEADALGTIIQICNPKVRPNTAGNFRRRDEPDWHAPRVLITVAQHELAHAEEVEAAFSAGYRVFADLPVFRNYFGHRNRETRRAAMELAPRYGVGVDMKPSEVLRALRPGRPVSVVEDWIAELSDTVEFLCS